MSEWNNNKLSYLVDIRVSNVDKKIYPNKKKVKLCNYMDAYSNDYITSNIKYSEGSADLNELNRFRLIANDVIITKDSETPEDIAVSAVVAEEIENLICGYHLAILRPRENRIHGPFLMHKLKLPQVQKYFFRMASGSTRYGLTIGEIENTELSHPPLPHQRKIARILTTVDNIIEKTEIALKKYKAIKQGMMHDLFTRGIDIKTGKLRPSYKDAPELYKKTELGMIPKEWEILKLDKISKINGRIGWKGYTVGDLRENGALALGAAQINKDNKLDLSKPVYLSDEKYLESPEIMVNKGDILIVQRGTIGKYVLIESEIGEATINPSMVLINNIIINQYFLYYTFGTDRLQRQVDNSTSQTGVPMISQEQICNFKIPAPSLKTELKCIASRLELIDSQISNESKLLDKNLKIKQALMQDLLTGEKEVTPDPEDFDNEQ